MNAFIELLHAVMLTLLLYVLAAGRLTVQAA
jgi:hypothetical protein